MSIEDFSNLIKTAAADEKVGAAFFKDAYEGQPYIGTDQTGFRATGDPYPQEHQTGLSATGDAYYGTNQTSLQRVPNNWPQSEG